MNFYKLNGEVYAFDDGQESLITEDMVAMSESEIAEHLNSSLPLDEQELSKTRFTSLEYLDRFTETEQLAVVTATLTSPVIKLWYDRLLAASFIDLEDPRTEAGIDALIAAELLAPGRKQALLQPDTIES
ncbi:hypothetical protein ACW4YW_14990 [Methylobacillus pratensis]